MGSTCYISTQICLYYEFMCQLHDMVKKITILLLYCWYLVISQLVRISRHVFFDCLHHPLTINHSVNIYEQVAYSLLPTKSHSPIVKDESVCPASLPSQRGEVFQKAGDRHRDIKTRRSEESYPSQGTPFAQIPLYAPVYYAPK